MTVQFCINYRTPWGQSLCVVADEPLLGWSLENPLQLRCEGEDFWTASVPVSDFAGEFSYRYAIRLEDGRLLFEAGRPRPLVLHSSDKKVVMHDFWQANDYEKSFYSTAFLKSLFRRNGTATKSRKKEGNLRFSIDLPQILPSQGVGIVGNIPELGGWNTDNKLVLSDQDFPVWHGSIEVRTDQHIEYKYIIFDLQSGHCVDIEYGENRHIWGLEKGMALCQNDRGFRRNIARWRGAGVAVPVFSLSRLPPARGELLLPARGVLFPSGRGAVHLSARGGVSVPVRGAAQVFLRRAQSLQRCPRNSVHNGHALPALCAQSLRNPYSRRSEARSPNIPFLQDILLLRNFPEAFRFCSLRPSGPLLLIKRFLPPR